MTRQQLGLWCIVLPALLLASCAREQPRAPSPTPLPRPAPAPSPAASLSPADYFARASSIDLFEVRSSELALTRSSSKRIQEFASMMVQAHRGTASQLSLTGRRLNLLPSAQLLPKHQAMYDALQSAADFDSTYRQQQRSVHEEAAALHRAYAANGSSPTLRPVAQAILPVVERHQRLLGYL